MTFVRILVLVLFASPVLAATLAAGSLLEVRLRQGLDSATARVGDRLEAVLIHTVDGLPAGSIFVGTIDSVRRVGVGLIHERARITARFHTLTPVGGEPIGVDTRIFQIENAREKLDSEGRIQGIRSTNTPGYRASGTLTSLAAVDPIALLFSTAAFASTLRFSDPEIRWAPGAELILELQSPIEVDFATPAPPAVTTNPTHRHELHTLIARLPWRTARVSDGTPSDITNLVFLGTPESIARAFYAAGWVEAMPSNASTRYRTLRSFAEIQAYQEAPMSDLTLNRETATLTLSKTLNTFARRHHLRMYSWPESFDSLPIFTAAATHDTDIVMSLRHRTITHKIDSNIDGERAKIINDLLFTGCIDAAESVERPWIDSSLSNGSHQPIISDRAIAVLRFNECRNPSDGGLATHTPTRYPQGPVFATSRHLLLRLRNDVIRGNLAWQAASWAARLRRKPESPVYERTATIAAHNSDTRNPSAEDGSSLIAPLPPRPHVESTISPRADWTTPTVELGFNFGTSLFSKSTVGEEAWILTRQPSPTGPVMTATLTAGNRISPGFAIGGTVTVHNNRWLSSEFGFQYLRGSFLLGLAKVHDGHESSIPGFSEQHAGLLTRQFSYSTVTHMRPLESRFRPYLAAGPALQLVHLTDAPFRATNGIFRLGLSNVGMVRSAYNFSSVPPLNGGGIFQPGLQFGAGFKYRVNNVWLLRLDYRNTMSHRPDFLRKSLTEITDDIRPDYSIPTHRWFHQQRVSLGFSFTF